MGISYLLFLGIFALLVASDVQSAHTADRAMFQNQFTSLSYQVATNSIVNKNSWEKSSTILRLWDESETILWQTNGSFSSAPIVLWESFDKQLEYIVDQWTGDELPVINQSNIMVVKTSEGIFFIGSRATIQTSDGSVQILEMLLPQTSVTMVLWHNGFTYLFILVTVLVVLGLLSHFLVLQALKPTQSSMQSQKNFIAAASHELKSPLSVIQLNNAEVKNMVVDHSKADKLLDISLSEGKRMTRLISDMLVLASSDAGHWKMRIEEINIETLLLQTYEKYNMAAKSKGIRIEMDLPNKSFPTMKGDQERIAQVLDILMDNAIRHSLTDDVITIQCKILGKSISISVIDHGVGISNKNKPFIFDRFFQVDASRTQRSNFGLGLCIAKEIMTKHKGRIEMRDTVKGGATFTIYLLT